MWLQCVVHCTVHCEASSAWVPSGSPSRGGDVTGYVGHKPTIQRPCYQRGSPCQDPGGNLTTRRPSDCHKEMQIAVVWSCLPFIRSGQNHLARHIERGKKTRQTEEEVGRQRQGMDRPGVRQVPEGSGEQGRMDKTGIKIICGAPTTLVVMGLMMMIPTELARSFLFCSCVCFSLYGPFNCISIHKFSRQLSVFSLCSPCLISLPYRSFQLYISL